MEELNRNRNPDQDQYQDQATYRIPKDLPPIILPDYHHYLCLVRRCAGRGEGLTRASGNIGARRMEKRKAVHSGEGIIKAWEFLLDSYINVIGWLQITKLWVEVFFGGGCINK